MAQVFTDLGPGEIIASDTVRGRTQHKVAGAWGEKWFDEASLGGTRMIHQGWAELDESNSVALPYDPKPQYPAIPGDTESTLQPIHHIDADERLSPADSITFADRSDDESDLEPTGPNFADREAAGRHRAPSGPGRHAPGPDYDPRVPPGGFQVQDSSDWLNDYEGRDDEGGSGPVSHRAAFGDYPRGAGGIEAGPTEAHDHWMQQNQGQAWEHESPYYEGDPHAPSQDYADHHGTGGGWLPEDQGYHPSDAYGDLSRPYPEDTDFRHAAVEHEGSQVHEAFAFLIPLMEGLMGAGGAAAGAAEGGAAAAGAAGAAEGAGGGIAQSLGQGAVRGVGSQGVQSLMGGGDDQQEEGQEGEEGSGNTPSTDVLKPGPGWGEMLPGAAGEGPSAANAQPPPAPMAAEQGKDWQTASVDRWLSGYEGQDGDRRLSSRYIDVTATAEFHDDPVAQFRHDPVGYIARIGHVYDEPISPEMEHYGSLVESNPNIREAAWKDVRTKAMRLRREGRVHVKDIDAERIYASVDGDHGTYDTMIVKGGAFGGYGGGHTITNWRCSCEWGRWAFKRQFTYVGRLCSHGYASYMEMNSNHMKGQPRQRKLTRPYTKRADALQNGPERLVPELVINDSDDAQQFMDVTKDERKDTGPDDIVSDQDIVHFATVMAKCEREGWPYPRQLVAFLERYADDESPSDWKIEDAGRAAGGALEEIRDWSDKEPSESWGHMEERNDDIRDAVDEAREGGTDASQFTAGIAFRTAAPDDVVPFETPRTPGGNYQRPPNAPPGWRPTGPPPKGTPTAIPGTGTPTGPGGNYQRPENAPPGWRPQSPTMTNPDGKLPGTSGGVPSPNPGGGQRNPNYQPGHDYSQPNGNAPATPGAPAATPGAAPTTPNAPGGAAGGGSGATNTAAPGGAAAGGKTPPASGGAGSSYSDAKGGTSGGSTIGPGEYKIQQGDTLSDIAQRAGYGGDYKALGDANADVLKGSGGGTVNYDKINAGDTIKIGDPKALTPNDGSVSGVGPAGTPMKAGEPGGPAAPKASDSPSTNAPGGPLNTNSGGPGADTPKTPSVDTSVAGGSPAKSTPATPATPTSSPSTSPGVPSARDTLKTIADPGSMLTNSAPITPKNPAGVQASRNGLDIFANQAEYDEWHRFAYPDSERSRKVYDHKPFNGSGGDTSIEFGTSEEYADKARKDHDDVTDLEHHNVNETDARFREHSGGIKRAGKGARRHVEPVVVREQKPSNGRVREAQLDDFADFDPLAPKTAASFDDPYAEADVNAAAQHIAANTDGDIVAQFQRSAGAAAVMASGGGQSNGGGFDIAAAAGEFLQRTAGRNYSPAEQHDLIREGDIGGAGNLGSLDLNGTHYDESKYSVGLF